MDLKALFLMRERDTAIRESPMAPVARTGAGMDPARSSEAVRQAIEFRAGVAGLRTEVEDEVRFEPAAAVLASAMDGSVLDALKAYLAEEELVEGKVRVFSERDGVAPVGSSVADFDDGLATVAAERARLADWVRWVEVSNEADASSASPPANCDPTDRAGPFDALLVERSPDRDPSR